jgi:bacterial polymer biosynthesis proteins, WecB/TagA/CpsF family
MKKYFGIKYQFNKSAVSECIREITRTKEKGYICVADGVSLSMYQHSPQIRKVFDEASVVTCDSGWVPLFIRFIYKINYEQYSGSELFLDTIKQKVYNMMFLGADRNVLTHLQKKMSGIDERIANMTFWELPFCSPENFDYQSIADQINREGPDIIWISLGMPKQELFMYNLLPFLNKGILIGVGAAFKFHSGIKEYRRAPKWMIRLKAEWLYRIFAEPKKQLRRCLLIIKTMPGLIYREYKLSKHGISK